MASPPTANVVLEVADALEYRAVVIDRAGDACLLGSGDEAFRQRIAILVARDLHRTFFAAERGIAVFVLLHAFEIRQHRLQVPPRVAEAFPLIVFDLRF